MDLQAYQRDFLSAIQFSLDNQENAQIQENEERIFSFLLSPYFPTTIFDILQSPTTSSKVIAFGLILLQKFTETCQDTIIGQEVEFVNKIVFLIDNPKFSFLEVKNIKKALTHALCSPVMNKNNKSVALLRGALLELILRIDVSTENERIKNPNSLKTFLHCVSAIVSSTEDLISISIFEQISQKLTEIWNVVLKGYLEVLSSERYNLSQITNAEIGVECETILVNLEIFAGCLKGMLKREKKYGNIKKKITNLVNIYLDILCYLLFVKIGNLNKNIDNRLFHPTQFEQLNVKLNSIQAKSMHGIFILYKMQKTHRKPAAHIGESQFTAVLKMLIASSIIHYQNKTNFRNEDESLKHLNGLLTIAFNFFSLTSWDLNFYELYVTKMKEIVVHIILPNIVSTEDEKEAVEDNPVEFVRYSNDLVTHRESKTKKVFLLKLLLNLCDSIDGTASFIILLSIDVLRYSLDGCVNNESNLAGIYPKMPEVYRSVFFKITNAVDKIETCFLILSVLRGSIFSRVDLKQTICDFVQNYNKILIDDRTSPIIKARYIQMIMLNPHKILNIKKTDDNTYQKIVGLLQWILSQIKGEDSVSKTATKSFFSYLTNKKSEKILPLVFSFFVDTFIQNVSLASSSEYLTLTSKFIGKFGHVFNDCLPKLESFLRTVGLNVMTAYGGKDCNLAVSFLRIISQLIRHQQLVINGFQYFDNCFLSLYPLFETDSLSLNNTFLEILHEFITNSNRISPGFNELFPYMNQIHSVNSFKHSELFWILNLFMKNDRSSFTLSKISVVFGIIRSTLENAGDEHEEFAEASAILLLQILIQFCSLQFLDEQIAACVNIYNNFAGRIFGGENRSNFLFDKILGLHLTMILYISREKISSISSPTYLSTISQAVITNYGCFQTTYEFKLMILGMIQVCKLLIESGFEGTLSIVGNIVNFLLPLLKFAQLKSLMAIRNTIKKNLELKNYFQKDEILFNKIHTIFPKIKKNEFCMADKMDDQQLDEEINIEEVLQAEHNIDSEKEHLVRKMKFAANSVNEYQKFRELLEKINQNPDFWNALQQIIKNNVCFDNLKEVVSSISYVKISKKDEKEKKLRKIVRLRTQ